MTYFTSPVSTLNQFNREFSRLFDDRMLDQNLLESSRERNWSPRVDITEDEDVFTVLADVPGVSRDAIEISLHRGVLTIRGERSPSEEKRFSHRERINGTFTRQFNLPESADEDAVTAKVNNGVLEITIPKSRHTQPISITVAGD